MLFQSSYFCILLISLVINAEIPDYIKVCPRSVPDMSACIVESVEYLREHLNKGIPKLDLPPLDPVLLDDLHVTTGINMNLTEIVVKGTGRFKIKDLKAEVEKNRYSLLLEIPVLNLRGRHSINMKLLTIPLTGKGSFSAKFTNLMIAAKLKGRIITDNGIKHFRFSPFDINMSVLGKKELDIDGLFEDNPTLKRAGKEVIAENVDIFVDELRPEIEKSISATFTRLANQITMHFNYDELFPH